MLFPFPSLSTDITPMAPAREVPVSGSQSGKDFAFLIEPRVVFAAGRTRLAWNHTTVSLTAYAFFAST
jgi:hypothetical protein